MEPVPSALEEWSLNHWITREVLEETHLLLSTVGSGGEASACNAGYLGSIPRLGRSLEKEMATHSSILAWRIPWTEEPSGLQSTGLQRVRRDWTTSLSLFCSRGHTRNLDRVQSHSSEISQESSWMYIQRMYLWCWNKAEDPEKGIHVYPRPGGPLTTFLGTEWLVLHAGRQGMVLWTCIAGDCSPQVHNRMWPGLSLLILGSASRLFTSLAVGKS